MDNHLHCHLFQLFQNLEPMGIFQTLYEFDICRAESLSKTMLHDSHPAQALFLVSLKTIMSCPCSKKHLYSIEGRMWMTAHVKKKPSNFWRTTWGEHGCKTLTTPNLVHNTALLFPWNCSCCYNYPHNIVLTHRWMYFQWTPQDVAVV